MPSEHAQIGTLCRHIGLLFGKRLDTILLRHRIRKYPDSSVLTLSDSLRIYFFHSDLESGFKIKYPDTLSNSPDTRGRNPYPERNSCGFKNIRIRCRIRRIRVDGIRIRREIVADSKISGYAVEFAGYAWTESVSGKK